MSNRAGMAEVTHLDAIMHNKYARTPETLRAWQSASHIEHAPKREKKPAPPPAPPRRPRRRSNRQEDRDRHSRGLQNQ